MINLLPLDSRRQLKAARANTLLVRYVIITAIIIACLLGLIGVAYQLLSQQVVTAEQHIAENHAKTADFQQVQAQADALRGSLDTAKTALSSDIHYSSALLNIAAALPPNVSIKSLSLDSTAFDQPMTLETTVESEDQAYAIRSKLQESKFVVADSVKFGKLTAPSDSNSGYTLQVLVTFTKDIAQ